MVTETEEEFMNRMEEKIEERAKFVPLNDWDVCKKFAKFVCLSNINHTFQSDKPTLTLRCPECGGLMEMDNLEDFE